MCYEFVFKEKEIQPEMANTKLEYRLWEVNLILITHIELLLLLYIFICVGTFA